MVYDDDLARLRIPSDVDINWLRGMADPSLDLTHPMKGPFQALRDGDASLERAAISLCKQAHLLPTAVVVPIGNDVNIPYLMRFDVSDMASGKDLLAHIAVARVPLAVSKNTRVHVFGHGSDYAEHYAIEVGDPPRDEPVLSRLTKRGAGSAWPTNCEPMPCRIRDLIRLRPIIGSGLRMMSEIF